MSRRSLIHTTCDTPVEIHTVKEGSSTFYQVECPRCHKSSEYLYSVNDSLYQLNSKH